MEESRLREATSVRGARMGDGRRVKGADSKS